jgi:hypothetical protein
MLRVVLEDSKVHQRRGGTRALDDQNVNRIRERQRRVEDWRLRATQLHERRAR